MKKTIWVLLDSRMGSVGQAKGVMQHLDPDSYLVVEKNLEYTKLSGLPNFLRGKTLIGLKPASKKQICPPYPDIVLSTSRRTVPIARFIKKEKPGVKLVQLMYPGRTGLKEFELAIVPEHDKNKTFFANIRYVIGCPHRVTPPALLAARQTWAETFQNLPHPLTTVIIGGSIKGKEFSVENAREFGQKIRQIKEKIGGSLLITSSKRTGKKAEDAVLKELEGIPCHTFLWGEKKDNPFLGYLACTDNIIVSGDSVSMCCEACGTGKQVLIFTGRNWLTRKHIRFVASLYKNGYAAALNMRNLNFQSKGTLNAACDAVSFINQL